MFVCADHDLFTVVASFAIFDLTSFSSFDYQIMFYRQTASLLLSSSDGNKLFAESTFRYAVIWADGHVCKGRQVV